MIDISKDEFIQDIKINTKLMSLQKKLKYKNIKIRELKEETKKELIEQYKKQIVMKRKELYYIKKQILKIKRS